MNKKIMVVVSSLDIGGTETHICQIFPRLKALNYRIRVFTTKQPGAMASLVRDAGIKVSYSKLAKFVSRFGRPGRIVGLMLSATHLCLLNLIYRPYIVHCYLPGPYILGGLAARLTRRPHLIMSRRGLNYYQKHYPKLTKVEYRLHKKASRILANSQEVLEQLKTDEQVNEARLRLIYNGVLMPDSCSAAARSLRSELGISTNSFVMIIVANLFPYKGHIDLLRALNEIKDKLPPDWHLLCAGRDEGCLERLKDFAKNHGLDKQIHWLGQRSDAKELLSIAQIGILCSHEEGFSNSILEGMAAGLPMVVTRVGGNAEAVVDQVSGYVVPAKNPMHLSQAILRLASDENLRKQMGQAARERASELFSIERCIDAYKNLYAELSECVG